MADPHADRTGITSGTTGMPVWLKVVGMVVLIGVVVVVVIFAGGVNHGPGLHGAP